MTPTLYLTRNGLLEPLGQSQVFPYLQSLSTEYRCSLISYEKDDHWADTPRVTKMRRECQRLGIRWLPQRFRPKPKVIAPALSMVRMVWLAMREVRQQQIRLIHARSYIPATVALVVSRLTGVPFIFDMRALWPEELITAGRLRRGSPLHWVIVAAERACLRRASGVVSLTQAAVGYLRNIYPEELARQKIAVIPTCADLTRFVPASQPPALRVIGCLGTLISGWFKVDWLATFLAVAAKSDPNLQFQVTTWDDPAKVRALIGGDEDLQSRLQVEPCPSERVHEVLQWQMASVMFFTQGLSKLGSSPTRMAEILGCGLPVVANEGVGDVAQIIRKYRVGVLVNGPSEREIHAAWDELQSLLGDSELPLRCRRAAEEVFSLQTGSAAYSALYRQVLASANGVNRLPN